MNDIGPNSLSYHNCIWRSIIHKYSSEDGQYLYNAENTEYGIPVCAGISYKYNIFSFINDFIYEKNKKLNFKFDSPAITLKTRKLFSDTHFAYTAYNKVRLFNDKSQSRYKTLAKMYISLFTRNYIALANVFYDTLSELDVYTKVFNKKHIFLENWLSFDDISLL